MPTNFDVAKRWRLEEMAALWSVIWARRRLSESAELASRQARRARYRVGGQLRLGGGRGGGRGGTEARERLGLDTSESIGQHLCMTMLLLEVWA